MFQTYRDKIIEQAEAGFKTVVLSNPKGARVVYGKAKRVKPGERAGAGNIAIIDHAGPEYEAVIFEAVKQHGAVITATGGRVAHLAIVSREVGALLVMWPLSIHLLDGDYLTIDSTEKTITLGKKDSNLF